MLGRGPRSKGPEARAAADKQRSPAIQGFERGRRKWEGRDGPMAFVKKGGRGSERRVGGRSERREEKKGKGE